MNLHVFSAAMLLSAGCFAQDAVNSSVAKEGFETPLKQGFIWKNNTGKVWLTPNQKLVQDLSGTKAHTGRGALGIPAGVSICMDAQGFLETGKTYELSVWAKPAKPNLAFSINFIWFGQDGKVMQRNCKDLKLRDTAWQKISVSAKVPANFKHFYMLIHTGTSKELVYIDDIELTEQKNQ